MLLNTTFSHIARIETGAPRDVLSFVLSLAVFTPPRQSEITVTALIFTPLVVLVLILVVLNMLWSSYNFPPVIDRYLDVFFRCVPVLFVPFVNVFLRSYYSDTKQFAVFTGILIVLHLIMIIFIALMGILANVGPYLTNHVFLARTPMKNVILTTYFLVITHLTFPYGEVSEYITIVRLIVSGIVTCIEIATPLYVHPFMNFLFLTLVMSSSVTQVLLLTNLNWRYAAPVAVLGSAFLSLVVTYGLMNFFLNHSTGFDHVYYLFISGKRSEAKYQLEELYAPESSAQMESSMQSESGALLEPMMQPVFTRIKPSQLRMAVQVGIELKIENLDKLIYRYGDVGLKMTHEIFFIWSATHCYASIVGGIPVEVDRTINTSVHELDSMENEFWRLTWLSHRQSLSKLAADMGRKRYILHEFFKCNAERFTCLWQANDENADLVQEVRMEESISRRKCCKCCHPILFLYFAVYLYSVSLLIGMYIGNTRQNGEIENDLLIANFVGNISQLTLDWVFNATAETAKANAQRSYQELLASSHPLVRAFLESEVNGTTVSREYDVFMKCIQKAPSEAGECVQRGSLLRLIISLRIDRQNYYDARNLVESDLFKLVLFVLTTLMFLIVLLAGLGTYLRAKAFVRELFKPFTRIPKSFLNQDGAFNCKDDVTSLPIRGKYTLFEVLPATTIFYATSFVGMMLGIGAYCLLYAVTRHDVRNLTDVSRKVGRIQNVQAALAVTASFSFGQTISSVSQTYHVFDESLQVIGTDPFYEEFMWLIPNELYTLMFAFSLQSRPDVYTNMTFIVTNMSSRIQFVYWSYSSYARFSTMRFVGYISVILVIGYTCLYVVMNMRPIMAAEQNEGQRLYRKHPKDSDRDEFDVRIDESTRSERRIVAKDKKIEESKLPVTYVLVDEGLLVEQITAQARQHFQIAKGLSFQYADQVTTKLMTDIINCIDRFKKEMKSGVVVLRPESGLAVHLSPFYSIESGKKMLVHTAIVFTEGTATTVEAVSKKHADMFHTFFPKFVPVDAIPFSDTPNVACQMYLMIVKLTGFHKWASTVSPECASEFRSRFSLHVDSVCNVNPPIMFKIGEHPDLIVLRADRDIVRQDWNYSTRCLPIGESILSGLRELVSSSRAPIDAYVFVFRASDPGFSIPNVRLGNYDANSDLITTALDHSRGAIPWQVNIATAKGELPYNNLTKVRKCKDRDGTDFSIWLIV